MARHIGLVLSFQHPLEPGSVLHVASEVQP
jgi:hypothetical protein